MTVGDFVRNDICFDAHQRFIEMIIYCCAYFTGTPPSLHNPQRPTLKGLFTNFEYITFFFSTEETIFVAPCQIQLGQNAVCRFFQIKVFSGTRPGFFSLKRLLNYVRGLERLLTWEIIQFLNVSWKLRTIQSSVVWIQATINTRFAVFKFMNKILESEAFSICKKRSKSCVNTLHKNSCEDSNE